jgi:hypothetical protein
MFTGCNVKFLRETVKWNLFISFNAQFVCEDVIQLIRK